MRVGLTGGIGSGKSVVAAFFADLGAFVIDTDELAREAVAPESAALAEIARAWPQAVRGGILDRATLADIVFADVNSRARLNEIVHPQVRRLAAEREKEALPGQLIVQVVPLLFETHYSELVDRIVVVVAPVALRIARVAARDAAAESRVRARMAAQIDPDAARLLADYTIENNGDLAHLQNRTREVYDALTQASG